MVREALPGEGGGLSDTLVADNRMNQNFRLRPTGFNNEKGISTLTWSNIMRCFSSADNFNCSTRRNGVAYFSPTWSGFSGSWGYFEDDIWGAALRYKKDWGDNWAVAASAGYEKFTDERLNNAGGGLAGMRRDFNEEAGSAAIKHKPSGLFLYGAWSISDSDDSNAIGIYNGKRPPEFTAWDIQGGIERKLSWFGLNSLGVTSFWGGFQRNNDGFAEGSSASNPPGGALGGVPANGFLKAGTFASVPIGTQIVGSEVDRWFLALDQGLESAAMHVYFVYQHFDADVSLIDSNRDNVPLSLDDFDLFYAGGRIYF